MKQAQETSDFYPTRRAGEAPPEHVIDGGFKPDLSDTPDLPESGVTLKHVRETVRGILTALKGTATLLAIAVAAMLMAESITGTEGKLLDHLPGDSTVLLDAPAVKQLLESKAATSTVSALTTRLTAAEAAIEEVADAKQDKLTVDSTLSASSTNPIQNQAVKAALDKKAEKSHTHTISQVSGLQTQLTLLNNNKASKTEFNSDNETIPYVKAYGASMHSLRTVFNANNEADNWAEKFDNAKLTFEWWHQYNNVKEDSFDVPMTAFRELANGGGGHTEVWKANVGFGAQDTFIGAKRTADGDGQFLNGYPRLHNHGQDIHEVTGFSRDSRDDESVWSHRLLLPWDLAKANDTSYLMAGVVWDGQRNLFANGDTATFVQPLLPQNSGSTQSALPYAIPCFENSPVYWKGTIIWNDGTQAISKAVQIPWARVKQDMRGPDELALKRDIPSIDTALSTTSTNPVQNKAVKAALDGKADAFIVGEGLTLEAGVLKRDSAGAQPWVNETNDNYSHYLVNAREDLGDVGIRRAFAFAIRNDNFSNASIIYEDGIFGVQEIPFDIVNRLYAKQDKLTAGANITIENGVISASGGGEPVAREGHAIAWQEGTSLLTVTPNADGAVVFDPTGWPEGQSLLVRLTTPEDFGGVPASVRLVGYFDLEPASTYQLTAYVVGGTLHVVPLLRED